MAAYRRKLLAAGFSYVSSLMRRGSCQSRRLALLPAVSRKSWMTLGVTGALCAVPFIQESERVSHADLVRRASSLVVNSANTFLSQTTLALIDSLTTYIKAINALVMLHTRYVASISRLSPAEEEALWQVIVRQRKEIRDRKNVCDHFESCWKAAINISQEAADAAFNAGADQTAQSALSNLQLAQSQVEHAHRVMLEAERKLQDSNAEDSDRLQVPLSEDEDVPDAYLRED